jgi:two-component system cell cycle sensor histidine kinase/response regulator CckA
MTLRTKTSILLTTFTIIIFSLAGFLSLRFLENSLRESIFDGLESVSNTSSESISKFLDDTLRDTEAITSFLPKKALEEKNVSVIEEHLKAMVENYPKFENGMFLLDAGGTLWADYPVYPGTRGKNFTFREYFKTTMEKQKGIIGVPYRSARTGEAVLTFTALLRGSQNQILGLLGCSVQLLHPNALGGIRKTKTGESGYTYVYDTSRLMILHPEDKRILQRDVPPGANKLFDAAIEGFEGVGETVNSRGVHMLLSLKRIPGTDWIIGAQQPKSEAFASIKKARYQIIGFTLISVMISILIGAIVVRRLTEPIVKLQRVAMKFGQDAGGMGKDSKNERRDIQEELNTIRSSDEIGDLARAFREMYEKLGQAFTTLQESEERYRTLAEAAQEMIFIINREGYVKYVNQCAANRFKSLPDKIIGKPLNILFPQGISERQKNNLRKVFESGEPIYVENITSFYDGERWLGTQLVPIRNESGEVDTVLGISRDITDRKQMEAALRESEEKYRSLVDHANDAIFIAQDGMVKFPNPSTLALTGYSEEDYATIPFVNLVHPEDREMVIDRHNRRLRGEEVSSPYSFRIMSKAGEEMWVHLNAVLTEWEKRPAILCFIRDVTSHKRLEAQFQQAQKMEAVGTLAGGIAHDFNNLLQTVLGYTEILLIDLGKDKPGHQELQEVKRAAKRGAELTQQLLTFSRKVQSSLRPVDLNKEIKQVEGILKRTIPKMVEVELNLGEDLKTTDADPVQMEQVLMNLAVNARDAMPDGGKLIIGTENVTLDETFCKNHLGAKPGDYVALTVSDTGHGMDRETLKHIFDPFFTTKGVGKGTGLGLAMVYGIVKSHEGYILCESESGKGAIFRIYFPVTEQGRGVEEWREDKGFTGGTETILLVDDEEPIRNLGEQIFTKYGYTVLKAPDGESALKLYQEKSGEIELVVLDLIMPGMGGKKCLEGLLQINPEVKVVIASGYSPEGTIKSFLEGGAKNFIGKPFNMKEMLQVVREVIDEKV